ncbi:hypothetical protein QBC32DRAFT_378043 [Pseudoneurospora amorphoporcata]|uniref:Uncharacterized protein n=1 Tax=Pseudoneurospora amorphoporcata TaxID=241081 RepID=A0AAN6NPI5_9PEZI|nr:hypothetical protein QBC32DRAFT_378043 [Pseudoneurospora amorphoporcata]
MEHNNRACTIVHLDVEEFQSTSQQPHSYFPSPMDASNRGPSATLPTSSPPLAPRHFPTFAPTSPTYSPASPNWMLPSDTPLPRSLVCTCNSPPLPMSPVYTPSSPNWVPTSPAGPSASPIGPPQSPEHMPEGASPVYYPTSPRPMPPSPPYVPRSPTPEDMRGGASPVYYPTSPGPCPSSPAYVPQSPEWAPRSPSPTNHHQTLSAPVVPSASYVLQPPVWASTGFAATFGVTSPPPAPSSPTYSPESPSSPGNYGPFAFAPSPPYVPQSPQWSPTSPGPVPPSPSYVPLSPESACTSSPLGRFVYNRAWSIVPEDEEQRERGRRETDAEQDAQVQELAAVVHSQEPEEDELPDCQYYEKLDRREEGNTERVSEGDVRDQQVQQPAPAASEEDLPDYEYYEQLDQETEAEAEMQLDAQHSVGDPYPAIAAINRMPSSSSKLSNVSMTYDTKEEPTNWLFRPSFCSSSTLDRPYCRVSQRPIGLVGRVRVQKRLDRMMWNKLMRKKTTGMIEHCEKYPS